MSRRDFEAHRAHVPAAGQNPDPSFFGQRGSGHADRRREIAAEEARQALLQQQTVEQTGEDMRLSVMYEWVVTRVVVPDPPEPEKRYGRGWEISVDYRAFGGKQHAHVSINTDVLKDLTKKEIADALDYAMKRLEQEKQPQLSALHPGANKRRLLTL
jgi:hypothetical protein